MWWEEKLTAWGKQYFTHAVLVWSTNGGIGSSNRLNNLLWVAEFDCPPAELSFTHWSTSAVTIRFADHFTLMGGSRMPPKHNLEDFGLKPKLRHCTTDWLSASRHLPSGSSL